MNENPDRRLERLHQQWMKLTGMDVPKWNPLTDVKLRWAHLVSDCGDIGMEFEQALPIVIARIKREAAKFQGYYAHLSFYKITDASRFLEHLSFARGEERAKARKYAPGKAEVLRATGRPTEPETPPARSAADVINSKEFQEMVAFRKSLKP